MAQTYIKSVLYSPTCRHSTKHATQCYWSTLRFMLLQMFHNRFIDMGVTWLITTGDGGNIDPGFRSQGVQLERGGKLV